MTKFRVYQATLTDGQRDELNGPNGGWDSKPEFSTYADLFMGSMGGRDPDRLVREAARLGLLRHVCDIEAEDVAQTFEIGNIGPEERITRYDRMTSLSVGNIVVDTSTDTAWFCDMVGWIELFSTTLGKIRTVTVMNERMSV